MTQLAPRLLLIPLIFILLTACGDKKVSPRSDLDFLNIKGNVSSIKSTKDNGKYDVILFNDNGTKISQVHFNPDDSITQESHFTYDEEGYLSTETSMVSNKKIIGEIQSSYDSKGRLLSQKYKSEKFDFNKYSYNDKNQKIERQNIEGDEGSLESTTNYTYNQKDLLEKQEWVQPNGSISSALTFKYNDKGVKTKQSRYADNDRLFFTSSYNDKGDLIKSTQWDIENNSEVSVSVGSTDYSYEYDKNNNWIKRKMIAYKNGSMIGTQVIPETTTTSIIERVIEYRP